MKKFWDEDDNNLSCHNIRQTCLRIISGVSFQRGDLWVRFEICCYPNWKLPKISAPKKMVGWELSFFVFPKFCPPQITMNDRVIFSSSLLLQSVHNGTLLSKFRCGSLLLTRGPFSPKNTEPKQYCFPPVYFFKKKNRVKLKVIQIFCKNERRTRIIWCKTNKDPNDPDTCRTPCLVHSRYEISSCFPVFFFNPC